MNTYNEARKVKVNLGYFSPLRTHAHTAHTLLSYKGWLVDIGAGSTKRTKQRKQCRGCNTQSDVVFRMSGARFKLGYNNAMALYKGIYISVKHTSLSRVKE